MKISKTDHIIWWIKNHLFEIMIVTVLACFILALVLTGIRQKAEKDAARDCLKCGGTPIFTGGRDSEYLGCKETK